MIHTKPHNNYISRINTSTGSYHTYHGYTILFDSSHLAKLLTSSTFTSLKAFTEYPEVFDGPDVSSLNPPDPTVAKDPTAFAEEIRDTLASSLIFLHVWMREHPERPLNYLKESWYKTYGDFFRSAFADVILWEKDQKIAILANRLWDKIISIEGYLGPYQGALGNSIFRTEEIMAGLLTAFCVHSVATGIFK